MKLCVVCKYVDQLQAGEFEAEAKGIVDYRLTLVPPSQIEANQKMRVIISYLIKEEVK